MKLKSFILVALVACMLVSCKDNNKIISEIETAAAAGDHDKVLELLDDIDESELTYDQQKRLSNASMRMLDDALGELDEIFEDIDLDDYDDYDDYSYDYDDYDYDDYDDYDYDDYDDYSYDDDDYDYYY
jgi:hypothetical protein